MNQTPLKLQTPRGTFNIHTTFPTLEKAEAAGWHFWFSCGGYSVLVRDNTVGAVVKTANE